MPSSFYQAIARIAALFHSRSLDRDLDAEIETHLRLLKEEHIRRGAPPPEAARLARLEFGGISQLRESHRETRSLPFFEALAQDLRYTLRILRHNPGFTIFAVAIIGLGIAASSTVFSIADAILIRPLPLQDSSRLVWISNLADDRVSEWSTQVDHFLDVQNQNASFSGMAGWFNVFEPGDTKLTEHGATHRLSGLSVSCNFFPFLAISPAMGRNFTPAECGWNGPGAALLSYAFWRQHYAADPAMVGQTILLNDHPVTIVGIAPPSFDFGTIFAPGNRIDAFFPMPLTKETNQWGNTLAIVARLKPGVTVEKARAELQVIAGRLERDHPERNSFRPVVAPLSQRVTGQSRRAVLVLAWAVAIVMLIVCANVANLQLSRSLARQKEIAIRMAIGAGRRRLIRQMLTESLLLAGAGGVLGLLGAYAALRLLSGLAAFKVPLISTVRMDSASLAFSLLLALLSGIFFGLAPALQIPRASVHDRLKDAARASATQRHIWVRNSLVVSEIVFACVLLAGAGLLIRSFLNILNLDLGFHPEEAAALRIDHAADYSTAAERNAFCDRVLDRARALPGIHAAGFTDVLPLVGDRSWDITAKGKLYERGHYPEGFIRLISDGYLRAMGIPLRAGRDFSPHDTPSSELVAIVNETTARTLWPGQNPLGQFIMSDGSGNPARRVVGVVADVRHRSLEKESGCEVYLPLRQRTDNGQLYLVLRTTLQPAAIAASLRTDLRFVAPQLSTDEFVTLQDVVDRSLSPRRFVVLLLSGFSAFALILAALGIYAVISYSVNQRITELGIRMALGATPRHLQARVLLQALKLAAVGMLLGSAAAWFFTRTLSSLLFGVASTDTLTFSAAILILTLIACAAAYLPALRISRIDPQTALRAS